MKPTVWNRVCSVTGEGMNAGWLITITGDYVKYERDAIAYCESQGVSFADTHYHEFVHYTQFENEIPSFVEFQGKFYTVSDDIESIEQYAKKLNKAEKMEIKYGTTLEELYAEWVYINSDS